MCDVIFSQNFCIDEWNKILKTLKTYSLKFQGKKSAEDTLQTARLLMEHGLRELINTADSLGNTPLHHLIVRYALEERRYGYQDDHQPWNKWDMLHIVRFLLQNGARPSINQGRNSALACVLRYVL